MQSLKEMIHMNLFTKQKQTGRENKVMVIKGKGLGRGRDRLGVWN